MISKCSRSGLHEDRISAAKSTSDLQRNLISALFGTASLLSLPPSTFGKLDQQNTASINYIRWPVCSKYSGCFPKMSWRALNSGEPWMLGQFPSCLAGSKPLPVQRRKGCSGREWILQLALPLSKGMWMRKAQGKSNQKLSCPERRGCGNAATDSLHLEMLGLETAAVQGTTEATKSQQQKDPNLGTFSYSYPQGFLWQKGAAFEGETFHSCSLFVDTLLFSFL